MDITETQCQVLSRYLTAHQQSDTYSLAPLRLARVLAGEKPATVIEPSRTVFGHRNQSPEACVLDVLDQLECVVRRIKRVPGIITGRTAAWLDLLPTVKNTDCDAYHRRLGSVFGYPPDAIEYFIHQDGPRTEPRDLVRQGTFSATEMAYTRFVCYMYDDTITGYKRLITTGQTIRTDITHFARAWNLPALEAFADAVYEDAVDVYSGNGGSFIPAGTSISDQIVEYRPL